MGYQVQKQLSIRVTVAICDLNNLCRRQLIRDIENCSRLSKTRQFNEKFKQRLNQTTTPQNKLIYNTHPIQVNYDENIPLEYPEVYALRALIFGKAFGFECDFFYSKPIFVQRWWCNNDGVLSEPLQIYLRIGFEDFIFSPYHCWMWRAFFGLKN